MRFLILFLVALFGSLHAEAASQAKIEILLRAIDDNALAENIASPAKHIFSDDWVFQSGVGHSDVDVVWSDRRSLAAGASEMLDLAGVLTNSFGSTVTFSKIAAVLIVNRSTATTAVLHVGPDATNGNLALWVDASDKSVIGPAANTNPPLYGVLLQVSPQGRSVTAGSLDEWYLTAPSAAVDYDIYILGRSS